MESKSQRRAPPPIPLRSISTTLDAKPDDSIHNTLLRSMASGEKDSFGWENKRTSVHSTFGYKKLDEKKSNIPDANYIGSSTFYDESLNTNDKKSKTVPDALNISGYGKSKFYSPPLTPVASKSPSLPIAAPKTPTIPLSPKPNKLVSPKTPKTPLTPKFNKSIPIQSPKTPTTPKYLLPDTNKDNAQIRPKSLCNILENNPMDVGKNNLTNNSSSKTLPSNLLNEIKTHQKKEVLEAPKIKSVITKNRKSEGYLLENNIDEELQTAGIRRRSGSMTNQHVKESHNLNSTDNLDKYCHLKELATCNKTMKNMDIAIQNSSEIIIGTTHSLISRDTKKFRYLSEGESSCLDDCLSNCSSPNSIIYKNINKSSSSVDSEFDSDNEEREKKVFAIYVWL